MLSKVTPAALVNYWTDHHPSQMDIRTAMQCLPEVCDALPAAIIGPPPTVVHLLGPMGCGKTTFASILQAALAVHQQVYYRLDIDLMMVAIPGYCHDAADDPEAAVERWLIPARVVAYAVLAKLLERKCSVIFDHSGADERHPALLYGMQLSGYRVRLLDVRVDLETALMRNRGRRKGRYVPDATVENQHRLLESLRPKYKKNFRLATIDNKGAVPTEALHDYAGMLAQVKNPADA